VPAGVVCTLYALCTYIQPVEHGRSTIPVEHDSGTRINTRTPHYVLLLQVQVARLWMLDSWGFAGLPCWGFCRSARVGVMTAASHPASGLLHPASCIRFVIATFVQQASGFWVHESCKPYNFRAPKTHWFWCTLLAHYTAVVWRVDRVYLLCLP
jgi:hypothetical protein